jgi:cysteinyl-tRNA synthetase
VRDRFFAALAHDFNTAEALAALNEWLRTAARSLDGEAQGSQGEAPGDSHLREMLGVLGLEVLLAPVEQAPEQVRELAARRDQAREERDFATADRLRDEIASLGWEVRDGAAGFELLPL